MNIWDEMHKKAAPPGGWAGVEAFDITNILDTYWASEMTETDWQTLPNIAPPFRRYFMFGTAHKMVFKDEQGKRQEVPALEATWRGRMGVLFDAHRQANGHWYVYAMVASGGTGRARWQPCLMSYEVFPDGRLATSTGHAKGCFRFVVTKETERVLREKQFTEEQYTTTMAAFVYPFAQATSILHCKNVTARRVTQLPPKSAGAFKRGHGGYSYSVLDIAPMQRTFQQEGVTPGSSLIHALHMCRGHFKDYREGAGLFGRHKGLYWWEQNVRGAVEAGVHVKDYRVGDQ